MECHRGNAGDFFAEHGASCYRIDRGGSVWRIVLSSAPTPSGLGLYEFAYLLIEQLVSNFTPEPGDHIFVAFASSSGLRQLEWAP
jgi:hypothetical protein